MSEYFELTKDIVSIISNIVTILATILAGLWGYYRFVKGRVFKPRVSLAIVARCIQSDSINYVACTLEVNNVGLSKVDIDKAHVRLCLLSGGGQRSHIATRKVLRAHTWIEPGATLSEQEVIDCMNREGIAIAEFRVVISNTAFKATTIIEIPDSVVSVIKNQKDIS
jgi:hypothetical protein